MKPLLIYLVCSSLIYGCLGEKNAATEPAPVQELTLYNWAEYMPQSVLDSFTAEYGIKVNYLTYESMEKAVSQVRAGQVYDVVVVENNNIKALAADALLAQIDFRNIPNFKNISPDFRDLAFDPQNAYSIPYDYGTTGLLVRTDLVGKKLTRWADLWDLEIKGRIAVRPLAYELIGIALQSLGFPLNSEDPQQLEGALWHLLELKPRMVFVDVETSKAIPALVNGDVSIMVGWGNDALASRRENDQIEYVLPEEGSLLWGESFVIPANSRQKSTAELFLNFLLRPEISAELTNATGYATANQAAYSFIEAEIINDPIVFPPREVFRSTDWYFPLSPEGEKLYADIWKRFQEVDR
jgi:spermidine/putrescine transport system substrate-binding protein